MKKTILSVAISISILIILSIIASLSISLLQYYKEIKLNPLIIQIVSIIIFLLSGMIYGVINRKKGLLGSIIFVLLYTIFVLVFDAFTKTHEVSNLYFLFIIAKCLAYTIGTILSVNLIKK